MSKQISRMIQNAFGRRYNLEHYQLTSSSHYFVQKLRSAFYPIRHRWVRYSCMFMLLILAAGFIYYFNLLVTTEQDALAAFAKVDALLQRRNDISINLSKAVLDYAEHERGVFTGVVALRSVLPPDAQKNPKLEELFTRLKQQDAQAAKTAEKPPASNALSSLAQLLAVAEQYPDLKLSATFINLMTALIEVEKDLAQERIKYTECVNIYTTCVAKFPSNLCAAIFGFKEKPYFEASQEARKLTPIAY